MEHLGVGSIIKVWVLGQIIPKSITFYIKLVRLTKNHTAFSLIRGKLYDDTEAINFLKRGFSRIGSQVGSSCNTHFVISDGIDNRYFWKPLLDQNYILVQFRQLPSTINNIAGRHSLKLALDKFSSATIFIFTCDHLKCPRQGN